MRQELLLVIQNIEFKTEKLFLAALHPPAAWSQ